VSGGEKLIDLGNNAERIYQNTLILRWNSSNFSKTGIKIKVSALYF
jgi:hypothetical protein